MNMKLIRITPEESIRIDHQIRYQNKKVVRQTIAAARKRHPLAAQPQEIREELRGWVEGGIGG